MQTQLATNWPAIPIPVGGGAYSWDITNPIDNVYIQQASNPLTLVGNITISASGAPPVNSVINFHFTERIAVGAFNLTVFGEVVASELAAGAFVASCRYDGSAWQVSIQGSEERTAYITGDRIVAASVDNTELANMTRGTLKVGNNLARPSDLALGAANTVLKSDGTDAGWGNVVNANVDAAAAIATTKLAALTASRPVVTDASGFMVTPAATLSATMGGTGANNSAATGIQKWAAGTGSVSTIVNADITADTITPAKLTQDARTETVTFPVSWETGEQCNNRVQIGYACEVTNVYAVVTKALAGTDAGTIVPKDAAGVNMTLASALSFAASSALETAVDTAVTANNVVAAGDILYFTTAKTTVGGKALVSITLERTS